MANKKCPKCGKDMALRDGYGVCNDCGEIVAAAEGEEIKAEEFVADEIIQDIKEKEADFFATQIPVEQPLEEAAVYEEIQEETEEVEEVVEAVEEEERPEETFYVVPEAKGPSALPALVLILCAMLTIGAYYVVKDMSADDVDVNEIESMSEDTPPAIIEEGDDVEDEGTNEEVPVFDEPVAKPVETLEDEPVDDNRTKVPEATEKEPEPVVEPEVKPEVKPEEKPADKVTVQPAEKPAEKPVKKPVASTSKPKETKPAAPAVSYRVRKSANDSQSQIGAFADLEKAKNFARGNASDGYKVYDMEGNLVFQP